MLPVRSVRAVDLVVTQLRAAVLSGEFMAGSALPGERRLSVQLGVSRLTLRAAVSRLQSEGLLAPRQGDAVRVLDWRRNATLGLVPHLELSYTLARSFLELRRAVACEAVALACRRAGAPARAGLRHLAEAQLREPDRTAFYERDLAFARVLVTAAGNDAMLLLLNTVEGVYRAHPALAEALLHDLDAIRPSYAAVSALVEAGDPETARRAVREALEAQDARALRRLAREQKAREA
jgi:GntR family transcriptional regulator, transcriptional repressor for pyruvate dehydrogenase complex